MTARCLLLATSICLAPLSAFAWHMRDATIATVCAIVCATSIAYHGHKSDARRVPRIYVLDCTMARALWALVLVKNIAGVNSIVAHAALAYIPWAFFCRVRKCPVSSYSDQRFMRFALWHASLHVAAIAGTIAFLFEQTRQRRGCRVSTCTVREL